MNLKESNSTVPSMFGLLEESNSIIYLIIFVYDIDNVMVPLVSGVSVWTLRQDSSGQAQGAVDDFIDKPR